MRYNELITEAPKVSIADQLAKAGFTGSQPEGQMGTDGGSPRYYMVTTYKKGSSFYSEARKEAQAITKKGEKFNGKIEARVEDNKDPAIKGAYAIVVKVAAAAPTPPPTDRPLVKIPKFKDSGFAKGDEVEYGETSDSQNLGIIGVDGPQIGHVVADLGNGKFTVRPKGMNQHMDTEVDADNMRLVHRRDSWSGKGRYPNSSSHDINDYVELALHPAGHGGLVSLSGVNKKTGEREMILNEYYLDQIYNKIMQRGMGYQFSGKGVVPDKDWWNSLSPSEKQRYAVS